MQRRIQHADWSPTCVHRPIRKRLSLSNVFARRFIEKVRDLFAQICKTVAVNSIVDLLGYDSSLFLSASTSIRRVLDKWYALAYWYEARCQQAHCEKLAPPSLLLGNDRTALIQLLSILITGISASPSMPARSSKPSYCVAKGLPNLSSYTSFLGAP